MQGQTFTSVKIFSATKVEDRQQLGERVTAWIEANQIEIVDIIQTQSSDSRFHMVAISIFYNEKGQARIDHAIKIPTIGDHTTARRLSFTGGKLA